MRAHMRTLFLLRCILILHVDFTHVNSVSIQSNKSTNIKKIHKTKNCIKITCEVNEDYDIWLVIEFHMKNKFHDSMHFIDIVSILRETLWRGQPFFTHPIAYDIYRFWQFSKGMESTTVPKPSLGLLFSCYGLFCVPTLDLRDNTTKEEKVRIVQKKNNWKKAKTKIMQKKKNFNVQRNNSRLHLILCISE